MAKLLVIDDKAQEFRKSLDLALDDYVVRYAADAEEGLAAVREDEEIACVLLDIKMPARLGRVEDEEGLVALREIRKARPNLPVLMLTASGEAHDMIRAIRMGAYHYLIKPPDTDHLRTLVEAAIANEQLKEKVSALEETIRVRDQMESVPGQSHRIGRLIGSSAAMRMVFGRIQKLADADVSVLILGESGTGKELVAREIHGRGLRAEGPFVAVNCANLTGTLLESELFGHPKGAFTGAEGEREGAFRAADGGTVFLDEISEMSDQLQSKLLRVLQERRVKPLGADREELVDVRILAATNEDIDRLVEEGKFREDLFYRLNVVRVVLPPLRERREDIPMLAEHFLERYDTGARHFLSQEALKGLKQRPWPGNVRELEHAVERALVLADGPELTPDDFERGQRLSAGETEVYDRLWEAVHRGDTPGDINRFAELYGKLALAEMMKRAGQAASTDREAGRLLGFIPEDDPGDRAYNNYRSWKRRVLKLAEDVEEEQ